MARNTVIFGGSARSLRLVLLALAVLALIFIYTLAAFLAAPPSEGFSRELAIGSFETGFISNIQSPVVSLVNEDETLTLIAMDGHRTSLVTLDAKGAVSDRFSIDLDVYKASQLAAYQDSTTLVLYYLDGDLNRAEIDTETHGFERSVVEPGVKSFASHKDTLVLEKQDGLYGFIAGSTEAPVPLVSGTLIDYAVHFVGSRVYLLASVRNEEAMDLRLVTAEQDFTGIRDVLVLEGTKDMYLKTIQDVFVRNQVLTGLFVWTDNKYGLNHLTVQQFSLDDGSVTERYSHSFPIHKGRFAIDEVEGASVSVIMQGRVHRGVNLVMAVLAPEGEPLLVPLTKTRELSQLSAYTRAGEERVLVFWDSIRATRAVKFASSHQALVAASTSLLTVNYLSLAGITIFVILASVFIGTVPYLLSVSLAPLLVMLGLNRFTPEYRNKAGVQNALAGLLGTALKLYLTWHLIHELGRFDFRPVLIGDEPWIYVALAASSVVSWLISMVHIRLNRTYGQAYLGSFAVYLFADYAQYIMMVLVYIGSAMILDKI